MNANLLRSKMVAAGMTQGELAAKMGVCKNTMSGKMTGQSSFTLKEVERLCQLLSITDSTEKVDIFLS